MGIKPSKCKSIFYNLQLPNYLNIKIFLLLTPEFLKFTYPTKQNFYFQKIFLSPHFSLSLLSSLSVFLSPRSLLTLPLPPSLFALPLSSLFLNGEHLGQYLLTEHIKVDENRVDITEMETTDNSGEAVTGGYLLELDFHYDNVWQWKGASGTPFAVKYPDEEDLTEQQFAWIKSHIAQVESVLYGGDFADAESGYAKYIDPESFVDYWLIYEICVNHELGNPGSVYLSKDRNGKLFAGPVWDFDWGTFSFKASPHAEWGLFIQWAWWYDRLFKDEAFTALARERWALLKPRFEQIFDFIATESDYIRLSWQRNFALWSISTDINGDEKLTFDAAVERMISVLRRRIDIIDTALR